MENYKFKFEKDLINTLLNNFFDKTINSKNFKEYLKWNENKNKEMTVYIFTEYLLDLIRHFNYDDKYDVLYYYINNKYEKEKYKFDIIIKDNNDDFLINLFIYILYLNKINSNIRVLTKNKINMIKKFKEIKKNNKELTYNLIELLIKMKVINYDINNILKDIFINEFNFEYDFIIKTKNNVIHDKKIKFNDLRKSEFYDKNIKDNIIKTKSMKIKKKIKNKSSSSKKIIIKKTLKKPKIKNNRRLRKSYNHLVYKKNTFNDNIININNYIDDIYESDDKEEEIKKDNIKTEDITHKTSKNIQSIISKLEYFN